LIHQVAGFFVTTYVGLYEKRFGAGIAKCGFERGAFGGPERANAKAVARPMPLRAPVTRTTGWFT